MLPSSICHLRPIHTSGEKGGSCGRPRDKSSYGLCMPYTAGRAKKTNMHATLPVLVGPYHIRGRGGVKHPGSIGRRRRQTFVRPFLLPRHPISIPFFLSYPTLPYGYAMDNVMPAHLFVFALNRGEGSSGCCLEIQCVPISQ
jgi:hypothetical protein